MANIGDVNDAEFQAERARFRDPRAGRLLGRVVRAVPHGLARGRGDRRPRRASALKVAKLNIDEQPRGHPHVRRDVDPLADPVQGRQGGRARGRRQAEGRDPDATSRRTWSRSRRLSPVLPRLPRPSGRRTLVRVRTFVLGDGAPRSATSSSGWSRSAPASTRAELDGAFGDVHRDRRPRFQERRNLRADGMVGPDTWGQLVEAGFQLGDRTLYLHAPSTRGDDVRALQRKLNGLGFDAGREDGRVRPAHRPSRARVPAQRRRAGRRRRRAAHARDARADAPRRGRRSRAVVREGEEMRLLPRPALAGRTVAIDPGPAATGR